MFSMNEKIHAIREAQNAMWKIHELGILTRGETLEFTGKLQNIKEKVALAEGIEF